MNKNKRKCYTKHKITIGPLRIQAKLKTRMKIIKQCSENCLVNGAEYRPTATVCLSMQSHILIFKFSLQLQGQTTAHSIYKHWPIRS